MRAQIVGDLLDHPFAACLFSRSLDETLKDGSKLLMENGALALNLREGLKAYFRGPRRSTAANVEGEDIEKVEQSVLVVSLLEIAGKRLAEEDLRLARPAERFEEAGGGKHGPHAAIWPLL